MAAYKIVKEFKPSAAIGVGGYASGPLLMAASFAGVPCVIQEQNFFAGITNRYSGKTCKENMCGLRRHGGDFPERKNSIHRQSHQG
jgi:UDP-N-acetylglucosamine:LPS N-acetylglucosamine transferase